MDPGSQVTLVTERLAQLLRLPKIKGEARVDVVGKTQFTTKCMTCFEIGSISGGEPFLNANPLILKSLTEFTSASDFEKFNHAHLANLPLADNDPSSKTPIDILLDSDLYSSLLLTGVKKGNLYEAIAQETIFGWIISGSGSSSDLPRPINVHSVILDDLNQTINRFWEIEEVPSVENAVLTPEEQQCENHFSETHSCDPTGRYIVRLPFRSKSPPFLGNSRTPATAKFCHLERQLKNKPSHMAEYVEFMNEYESFGHMDKVDDALISPTSYYLPHHAVIRETSLTTRLRVVFNASARTLNGMSLNDHLLVKVANRFNLNSSSMASIPIHLYC